MPKDRGKEEIFLDAGATRPGGESDRDQDERWNEALTEAKQSVFEIFEDRGPGVSVAPAGLARRDERGRR
jgi:hypothetical protein